MPEDAASSAFEEFTALSPADRRAIEARLSAVERRELRIMLQQKVQHQRSAGTAPKPAPLPAPPDLSAFSRPLAKRLFELLAPSSAPKSAPITPAARALTRALLAPRPSTPTTP